MPKSPKLTTLEEEYQRHGAKVEGETEANMEAASRDIAFDFGSCRARGGGDAVSANAM